MSMLKVDLLPSYVRERRAVKTYMAAAGVLLSAVTAAMVFWYITQQNLLTEKKAKLELATQKKTDIEGIRAETAKEKGAAEPIKNLATFFRETKAYGPAEERLLKEVARYTFGRVRVFSITPTDAPAAGDPNAMGMGGMDPSGMGGGAMGMGMMGGGASFGATGVSQTDIKALLLDCWTDDYANLPALLNNLKRSSMFQSVIASPFALNPQEGPGSGAAGGAGGAFGGMPAMMGGGMAGGFGQPGDGSTPPTGAAARLKTSRNGVNFTITLVLAQPIKAAVVPGTPPPVDPNAMGAGMGMSDPSMMGGAAGSVGASPTGDAGATGGAAGDAGATGGETTAERRVGKGLEGE